MTANSTEAETDRAIPLDKLSSRVGDQTGREGYVVFVLNIGRAINISHTTSEALTVTLSQRERATEGEDLKPNAVYGPTRNGSHH